MSTNNFAEWHGIPRKKSTGIQLLMKINVLDAECALRHAAAMFLDMITGTKSQKSE